MLNGYLFDSSSGIKIKLYPSNLLNSKNCVDKGCDLHTIYSLMTNRWYLGIFK